MVVRPKSSRIGPMTNSVNQKDRGNTRAAVASTLSNIFAAECYQPTLEWVDARKRIGDRFCHELITIRFGAQAVELKKLEHVGLLTNRWAGGATLTLLGEGPILKGRICSVLSTPSLSCSPS